MINQLQEFVTQCLIQQLLYETNQQITSTLNYLNRASSNSSYSQSSDFPIFLETYERNHCKSYRPAVSLFKPLPQPEVKDSYQEHYFKEKSYFKLYQSKKSYKPQIVSLKYKRSTELSKPFSIYESMKINQSSVERHSSHKSNSLIRTSSKKLNSSEKQRYLNPKFDSVKLRSQSNQDSESMRSSLVQTQLQMISQKIKQQQKNIDSQLNNNMQFSFCNIKNINKNKTQTQTEPPPRKSIRPSLIYRKQRSYSMKEIQNVHTVLQDAIQDIVNLKNKVRSNIRTLSAGQLTIIKEPKRINLNIQRFKKK